MIHRGYTPGQRDRLASARPVEPGYQVDDTRWSSTMSKRQESRLYAEKKKFCATPEAPSGWPGPPPCVAIARSLVLYRTIAADAVHVSVAVSEIGRFCRV